MFTADKFSDALIDSAEGHLEWIADEALLSLPLWEGYKMFLKWLNEEIFFSAKFVYRDEKLIEHSVVFY